MRCRSRRPGARSIKSNCRSELFEKNYPISKKKSVESESDEGDIADLKSALFCRNFGDGGRVAAQIRNSMSLDQDFYHMGRCRMGVPFPKIGYNRDSEQY